MIVKKTERGWIGHYILASTCRFRRNTLLEHKDKKIVVSTVGMRVDKSSLVEIANGIYYETMCFYANENDQFNDPDVSRKIHVDGKWNIDRINAEIEANEMHENAVREISAKMVLDSVVLEADMA